MRWLGDWRFSAGAGVRGADTLSPPGLACEGFIRDFMSINREAPASTWRIAQPKALDTGWQTASTLNWINPSATRLCSHHSPVLPSSQGHRLPDGSVNTQGDPPTSLPASWVLAAKVIPRTLIFWASMFHLRATKSALSCRPVHRVNIFSPVWPPWTISCWNRASENPDSLDYIQKYKYKCVYTYMT